MNYDNEKLLAIKTSKSIIKKKMDESDSIGELIQLKEAYNILSNDEKELLKELNIDG